MSVGDSGKAVGGSGTSGCLLEMMHLLEEMACLLEEMV